MGQSKIIVSLDFSEMKAAIELASKLDPNRCRLKIGKELFTLSGPVVIENLMQLGFDIFLDLKFHDIPNTVACACKAAAKLGVWMINVHALGGRRMLIAAREAIDESIHQPILIAVTILTSLSNNDLKEIGLNQSTDDAVLNLAKLSAEAGLSGVVCSAKEAQLLRRHMSDNFYLVTPGIRPLGIEKNDQSRTVTPSEAILAGSNYLVIGRPITQSKDPLKALDEIEQEINKVLIQGLDSGK